MGGVFMGFISPDPFGGGGGGPFGGHGCGGGGGRPRRGKVEKDDAG